MPSPDTPLTKEDFDQCDWEAVVEASDRKECSAYMGLFLAKAQEAGASGDERARDVIALLSAITSLHPQLDSPDEPFGPMWVFNNSRSAIPDDFSDAQLEVLKEVAPEASDPELRARIADVLWVTKRDFRMAQLAIDSYVEAAEALGSLDYSVPYTERIERALQLAASLGGAGGRFSIVVEHVEGKLVEHDSNDSSSFPFATSMRLLQQYRQGDPARYAPMARRRAELAESAREWRWAREYWEIKARWSQMQEDDEGRRNALINAAETCVKEAEEALNRTPPSYIVASSHLTQAIEGLRRAGGARERVEELRHILLDYQRRAKDEMESFSATTDLTEVAEQAREGVRGKTLLGALGTLVLMLRPSDKANLRRRVIESAKGSISALASMNVVNDMGRVVARRPSRFSNDPEEVEEAVKADMYTLAAGERQVYGGGVLEPARQQIKLEHNVRIPDMLPLVQNNPFVPEGREMLYAQGLYYGLIGNFLLAAHLLIPQLEHSVRHILSESGVLASTLSSSGIQEERNLNQTLYEAKLEELWGEDLVFDLQGLLVERFGSNLRNKMAHGLMEYEEFSSYSALYLWWVALFLCYVHLAIQQHNSTSEAAESQEHGNDLVEE